MKRIIAVVLAVIIAVFSLPVSVFAATDAEANRITIEQFSKDLLKVVREYDKSNSYIADESLALTGDEYEYAEDDKLGIEIIKLDSDAGRLSFDGPEIIKGVSNAINAQSINALKTNLNNGGEDLITREVVEALGFDFSDNAAINKAYVESALRLRRLIVKSDVEIKDETAAECIGGYNDLYILQYDDVDSTIRAFKELIGNSHVEYVEPDGTCVMQETQISKSVSDKTDEIKDTIYSYSQTALSWASNQIGFDAIKEELSKRELEEVKVAILDSGVDSDHEFLADRLNLTTCNLSTTGEPNSCEDDYGHGTHVAGIVVDNTLSNVKIEPYKVLNNEGKGSLSLVAIAVDLAVANGANIINMSLTGAGSNQTLKDSVDKATENGVIVVVAAGNDSADLDTRVMSPACIESAITVSSVSRVNTLSVFSNYGSVIDIAAPGENIKSSGLNNTYLLMSGTSMASPLVAAGAAIIKSVYPTYTAEQVGKRLEDYSSKIVEKENSKKFGKGILYLKYILHELPRVADPVFSVTNTEFSEQFQLRLSCPDEDATILYLLNSEVDSPEVGILKGKEYSAPLTIASDTKVTALAIAKGKVPSSLITYNYKRVVISEDSKYDINKYGVITAYYGHEQNVVIPETIKGITATAVGVSLFKDNTNVISVELPDTVNSIGVNAFSGCTSLESVKGNGLVTIYGSAFQNSTIKSFSWDNVTTISSYAFSGCNSLENVSLPSAVKIEKSAFENTTGLTELHSDNIKEIGISAFANSDVESVTLPNVTTLGKSAFNNCTSLKSVQLDSLKSLSDEAFANCIKLSSVQIPSATNIGNKTFVNTAIGSICFKDVTTVGSRAFSGASIATYAYLPKATVVRSNAFENCASLEYVYMPALKTVEQNILSGSEKVKFLYLPEVTTVNKDAFAGSSIVLMMFEKVKTINSLPQTLEAIMLPSTVEKINVAENINSEFYGSKNTVAEEFAQNNNLKFNELPAIIAPIPSEYSIEDEALIVWSVGYNCSYKWYISDDGETQNGKLIDGENKIYYVPKAEDDAAYYYCEITQTDGEIVNTIVTPAIKNDLRLQNADFTKYETAVELAKEYDSSLYSNYNALSELLAVDVSSFSKAEQDSIDAHTQKILDAIDNLQYKAADYTEYDKAVAKAKELDSSLYESFAELESILEIDVSNKDITQQSIVDEQTAKILDAIDNLQYKAADYTEYDKAVAKAKELDSSLYESFAELESILETSVKGKDITQQSIVDEQTAKILDAIDNLQYKSADFSKIDEALSRVPKDLSAYTDESVERLNELLAHLPENANITSQSEVDAFAEQLSDAVNSLQLKADDMTNESIESTTVEIKVDIPRTGAQSDSIVAVAAVMLLTFGVFGLKKKKDD